MLIRTGILLLFAFFSFNLYSQSIQRSIICVNGNYTYDNHIKVSHTIGEPIAQTFKSFDNNMLISQGFEQKLSPIVTTGFEEFEMDIAIYPNPTFDFIYLNFSNFIESKINIEIFGADGKLYDRQTALQHTIIDFSYLSSGTYFLRLYNYENNQMSKAIPIQKLN